MPPHLQVRVETLEHIRSTVALEDLEARILVARSGRVQAKAWRVTQETAANVHQLGAQQILVAALVERKASGLFPGGRLGVSDIQEALVHVQYVSQHDLGRGTHCAAVLLPVRVRH